MTENPEKCAAQNGKAKSEIVSQIAKIVRKHGLDYDGWRYITKQVRKECELRPAKRAKKLPRVLTAVDFRRFYKIVDQADDIQHALMLRLLFYTGVRVSLRNECGELSQLRNLAESWKHCRLNHFCPPHLEPAFFTENQVL